jgi:translation initiation factor 3 subunit C
MEATKAVVSGDWEIARDFICNLKIWELLSNAEEVKVMLGL